MWNAIKFDYDDVDSDDEDEEEENNDQEVVDDYDLGPTIPRSFLSNDERRPTISRMIQDIHQQVVVRPQNKLQEKVGEMIICLVCLHPPEDFTFFPHCKRYLGCLN